MTIELYMGRAGLKITVSIRDAFKMQTTLMHVFEELHTADCDNEDIGYEWLLLWPGVSVGSSLATDGQLETTDGVRKLEELRLEKTKWLSSTLPGLELADKG